MSSSSFSRIIHQTLGFLGLGLALLAALLLCLPLALLPQASAVPAWLWAPLAAAGLALLFLFFRLRPRWKGALVALAGLLLTAALAVLASQTFAATPPIRDANGRPVEGSIASLERVRLNGSQQWISIRGQDTANPVLLFLAGGPGGEPAGDGAFRTRRAGRAFYRGQLGPARGRKIV
jgi:hypothetical protein